MNEIDRNHLKKEKERQETYMFVLTGVLCLCKYGKVMAFYGKGVSGWEWLGFVIFAAVSLVICFAYVALSIGIASEIIEHFGLQPSYVVSTIISIVSAFGVPLFIKMLVS